MCPAVLVLYICAKIQDASSKLFNHLYQIKPINSTNLSVLKILATHRLKVSKLQLAFQEIYQFLIQNNQFSVSA